MHQVRAATFGFMDEPDVPAALADVKSAASSSTSTTPPTSSAARSVHGRQGAGHAPAREHLFVLLHRGADSASRFFNLPTDRVFEVGTQVEI